MKKIMHIIQSPGGVERYIQMFLKNIDLSKYENILVCSYDYYKENYADLVVAFENVEMVRKINLKQDLRAVLQVRKLIKKYKPDIVYTHSSKAGAIGRIANLFIDNISLYNPHGWAFNMNCGSKKRLVYCIVEKLLAYFTDKIIAISDYEKDSAIKNKICRLDKIEVIYNGIDIKYYEENKEKYTLNKEKIGIPQDAYIIGTVGRLTKQKSPDVFIKAAAIIKKYIPNAYFLMVGNGDEQEQTQQLIKDLGLTDSVLITGWVEKPMEYILLFDQAMLLSRWEGFGLVLAEYMWAEKPIIATRVDAIENLIIDNVNGLMVDCDDIDEVVNKSIILYNDQTLCNNLVTKGKKIVTNMFSVQRVVEQHSKLLETMNCSLKSKYIKKFRKCRTVKSEL